MSDIVAPEQISQMQEQLAVGMARAESLEERMEIMMDMVDTTVSSGIEVDEESLASLEKSLTDEIANVESASFDPEIEEGLRKIKQELEKDAK